MYQVPAVSGAMDAAIQKKIDLKTKPRGSLGVIEALARQICRVQRTLSPRMQTCGLTIFAGDHGIVAEGVSAFPQEVTPQMVLNFLAGAAAANVFARTNGISVRVVDAGIAGEPLDHPGLISRRAGAGTANFLKQPAMSDEQAAQALQAGIEIGDAMPGEAAAFGEMGIGNTSSATLIAHKLTGLPVAKVTGRGTGMAGDGLDRKRAVLERAAARTAALDAFGALREYGGFEVAGMAGGMIGAARAGKVVLVDGFIATAAALVALGLAPNLRDYLVFSHQSDEAGHKHVLAALEVKPLLHLDMRLGEGTGAVLAWPLLKASAAMVNDMASFDSAGVSQAG